MISLRVPGTFSYKHLKFQKFNTFNFNFSMLLLLTILPPVMDGPRVHTSFSLDKRRSDRRALALRSSINDGGRFFRIHGWRRYIYHDWIQHLPTWMVDFYDLNGPMDPMTIDVWRIFSEFFLIKVPGGDSYKICEGCGQRTYIEINM